MMLSPSVRNFVCLLATVVAVAFTAAVSGQGVTVFGPKVYQGTGRPVLSQQTFRTSEAGGYTLRVTNRGISIALVVLDGRIVLRPSDFGSPHTRTDRDDDRWEPEWDRLQRDWRPDRTDPTPLLIEKPVTLRAGANQLLVAFIGRPSSSMTIEIVKSNPIDTTPPLIAASVNPAPNANGWNSTDVTVTFTCADAGVGIATCPSPIIVTSEGVGQLVAGTAVDKAGNAATTSVTLNIDRTRPTIAVALSPAADVNGTHSAPVTAHFTCSDALSGIPTCPSDQLVVSNGVNQTVTATVADTAGNSASVTSAPFNIDLSLPHATHAMGIVAAQPASVPSATPTPVLVTAELPSDSLLLPSSMRLSRYDRDGHLIADLGPMFDDGTHGDAVAADGVFSLTATFDEHGPLAIVLQVSADFSEDPTHTTSAAVLLPVTLADSAAGAITQLASNLRASNRADAYKRLGNRLNSSLVFDDLDTAALNRIADALLGCAVTAESESSETCTGTATAGGAVEKFQFFLVRDVFGFWRIISW